MVARKQAQLFYKAKSERESEWRFTALYGLLLWEPWLEVALYQVLANHGARTPGVDEVTKDDLREPPKQKALVDELRAQLAEGVYRPQPVKRIYIPKADGKQRPLGIPTIRDRVIQAAVKNLLEPIFEACFEDCSYGFRPNRGCWDALAEIGQYLKRPSNYEWVVEGDIRDCFGSIDHKVLMHQLRRRIGDGRLLTLIWHMLRAGVLENLRYYSSEAGTPQGGIVSPLLANVYMHQLDEWAVEHSHRLSEGQKQRRRQKGLATIRLTRYADDFVIAVKGTRDQAEAIRAEVAEHLKTMMRMDLSIEKTHITHRSEGFDFLGINVRYAASRNRKDATGEGRGNVYYLPAPKAVKRYKEKVRILASSASYLYPDTEVIRAINRFARGWANYYRHANSAQIFEALNHWTWHRVFRWLQRKHVLAPRAAYKRFLVDAGTPINRHPTRKDRRLGAWDELGRHLAIEQLNFVRVEYWKYRGTKIPPKYDNAADIRVHPKPPDYTVEAWPEGQNPRGTAEYRNSRELVRLRDSFLCRKCNRYTKSGHVHHKDGNPANPDPMNLELLCEACHHATESYGRPKGVKA